MRCYSVHFSATVLLPWMVGIDDWLAIDYEKELKKVEEFTVVTYQLQLSVTVYRISFTYGGKI